MANSGEPSTIISIKNRMARLGIDMEKHIEKIIRHWDQTPMGFEFLCKDHKGLMSTLVMSSNFGSDTRIGGMLHTGVSFREIDSQDSLHITLSTRPGSKAAATCSIHLDSVSPVAGRDPNTRMVDYNYGKVLQHYVTDAKGGKRFVVPSSDGGLVFGIRF